MRRRGAKTHSPKSAVKKRVVTASASLPPAGLAIGKNAKENDSISKAQPKSNETPNSQFSLRKQKRSRMQIIANWLFIIAGIGVALITIFLYYHRQTYACWITFTVIVLFGLGGCLQWQDRIWERERSGGSVAASQSSIAAAGHAFAAAYQSMIIQYERSLESIWYLEHKTPAGETISPVHIVMFMRFTNLKDFPVMIDSYGLEIKAQIRTGLACQGLIFGMGSFTQLALMV